ncbi:MAG: hypothetical protein SH850_16040 [Planctomycetaceae bacterium]|nr:hypothetical protein [Planctomycetaceae bacterium]
MLRPRRNPRLQERDYEILEHVRRYRLTTPEVLHQLFFDDSDRNAVTKVTSRLCLHEFLKSHPLYAGYSYYSLGRRGAKVVGLSPIKAGPLGPQAKYREYGTLAFCCRQPVRRERLLASEFLKRHPDCSSGRHEAGHYYDDHHESHVRLGFIWVEGAGDVNHVIHKVRHEIIDERRSIPSLRMMIDEGRFVVAIVTLHEEKKTEIINALKQRQGPVSFRVVVVPELRHLLPGVWHE